MPPYPVGPTSPSPRTTSSRYLDETVQSLGEASVVSQAAQAYAAPAYQGSGPSSTSRTVLLGLLGLLVGGQITWVYRHYGAGAGLGTTISVPSSGASRLLHPASSDSSKLKGTLTPTRTASQVPKNPRLSVDSLCVAIALKEERLELQIDDKRRSEILATLERLHQAEERRYKSVVQMRAAFTDEQAKEVAGLIQRSPYVELSGSELVRAAKKLLGKIANGTSPPLTDGAPVAAAEKFDWDQSLRGALALEKTNYVLTSSQAAQIHTAIPDWEAANQNLRVWGAQLNAQFKPKERQRLARFQDALYNRRAGLEEKFKAPTGTLRLIKAAQAALQG